MPKLNLQVSLMILFFTAFTGDFLRGLAGLAGPLLAATLHATDEEIGFVAAAYGLTYCFMPSIGGRISDIIGRKASLMIAMGAYAGTTLIYIFSTQIWMIYIAATCEGISLAFLWPAISALIVDLSSIKTKDTNTNVYMSSWNLGSIVGPFVAGFAYLLGAEFTFFLNLVASVLCFILVAFFMSVQNYSQIGDPQEGADDPAVLDKKTATDPTLMTLPKSQKITLYFFAYGMIILSAFYLNILSSYFGGFASERLGLSSAIIGIIVFCLPIGRGIAFTIMGRVTTQIKLKWTGLFTIIALCAILLVPLTSNIFALIGLFVLLGLISGFGFCGGFSMVVDLSEKNRGFYTGLVESMVGISFFVCTSVPFFIFGQNAAYSPFWFNAIVFAFLAVLFIIIPLILPHKSK